MQSNSSQVGRVWTSVFTDGVVLFYVTSTVMSFIVVVTTSPITCMVKPVIVVVPVPFTVFVGTSHIISIYHLQQGLRSYHIQEVDTVLTIRSIAIVALTFP